MVSVSHVRELVVIDSVGVKRDKHRDNCPSLYAEHGRVIPFRYDPSDGERSNGKSG